ncbi:MAG: TrbI/VirB10 family protein [Methylobacter sp.]|jgi:type IV secretion system protein VirB10
MTDVDKMSPNASPGEVSKKTGVRSVNNVPVYIGIGLLSIFLLIMILVAADRASKQNQVATPKEEKAGNTSMLAKEITGDHDSGIIQPQPQPDALLIARPDNLDAPPIAPSSQQQLQNTPHAEELNRIRMAKQQQLEEAIKAKTGVQIAAPRSQGSSSATKGAPGSQDEIAARLAAVQQQINANNHNDPSAAYKARLQQIQSKIAGNSAVGSDLTETSLLQTTSMGGERNDIGQFAGSGQGDRWKLDSQPEAPRSPYELRAGFVVPAVLISGINSELPGQIMAQVSQDVFDTPTGKWRLIPQGSRLVGSYASDMAYGQSRVLVGWQRIVFPDGKAMDIGSMPGADSAGYAGFNDQVNNHYARLFGSAILMSAVTAGFALSQPQTIGTNGILTQSASGAMSQALGQQLGHTTAQLIAKNMNVAPTLEIRPGYRFNVIVTKDMTFSKPYRSFDY